MPPTLKQERHSRSIKSSVKAALQSGINIVHFFKTKLIELRSESELHEQEFTHIEQLIDTGKFDEALQAVESLEKRTDLPPTDQLTCYLLTSTLLNITGQYNESLTLSERAFKESQRQRKRLHGVEALICKAEALCGLGRYEEGLIVVEQGEQQLIPLSRDQPTEDFLRISTALLVQKGSICYHKGDFDWALGYSLQSLALAENFDYKRLIAEALYILGNIYVEKSDFAQALEYSQQSLALSKEFGHKQDVVRFLGYLGRIYRIKGDYCQALEYLQQCLALTEEFNCNKLFIAHPLHDIGEIALLKGEYDQALVHLEQSLTLYEEVGNPFYISEILFHLVSAAINNDSLEPAQQYLQRLQELNAQKDIKVISQRRRVAEALVMKTTPRTKGKAGVLLTQVIAEEITDWSLTVDALLNLCALRLTELRATGNRKLLSEIQTFVGHLLQIAQQRSTSLLAEAYLLKSKLALMELDIQGAQDFLNHVQVIAEERGLKKLAMRISSEHDALLDEISKWEEFVDQNASLVERADLAHLEEQIIHMNRKQPEELPELLQEEPVLLLIMTELGLSVFSKTFGTDSSVDYQLISGILRATSSFLRTAFARGGTIERVKHQAYTLLLKTAEPFLVCYVIKGPSYSALKKINRFTETLRASTTVWQALQAGRLGAEKREMNDLIAEIFQAPVE